jgi:hypothetical protein
MRVEFWLGILKRKGHSRHNNKWLIKRSFVSEVVKFRVALKQTIYYRLSVAYIR